MTWFHINVTRPERAFNMIEFFAGDAMASKSCRMSGISTASLDVCYGAAAKRTSRAFDMTSDVGLVFLGCTQLETL